jgi:acyl-CoA synthetase (AMP-forming)/AMP-acid ligase II
VEAERLAHPAVEEACVVGIADGEWGQRVVATVHPGNGDVLDISELISFCRARLAGYKVPREIRFMDELPRNAAGKLLRRVLRDDWNVGDVPAEREL